MPRIVGYTIILSDIKITGNSSFIVLIHVAYKWLKVWIRCYALVLQFDKF
jgi:hypothetical protein